MDFSITNIPASSNRKKRIYSKKDRKNYQHQRNHSFEVFSNNDANNSFTDLNTSKNSFYLPQSISNVTSICINTRGRNCVLIPKKEEPKSQSNFAKAFSFYQSEVNYDPEEYRKEGYSKKEVMISGRSNYRDSRSLRPLKEKSHNQSFNSTNMKCSELKLGNEAKAELKKLDKIEYNFAFHKNLPSRMNLDEYLAKLKDKNNTSTNHYLLHDLQNRRSFANRKKTNQIPDIYSNESANPRLLKLFPQKTHLSILKNHKYSSTTNKKVDKAVDESVREVQLFGNKRINNENGIKNIDSMRNTVSFHQDLADKYRSDSEHLKQSMYKDLETLKGQLLGSPLLEDFQGFATPTIGEIDP